MPQDAQYTGPAPAADAEAFTFPAGVQPSAPQYGVLAPQPHRVAPQPFSPPGTVRSTAAAMLLYVVTLGFYGLFWYFNVHQEMKRHRGTGLGGGLALVLALFVSVVMPFLTAQEVGELYERQGRRRPVSGLTGLWMFLPLVGGIVWFVKVNGALNDYWRSLGAR